MEGSEGWEKWEKLMRLLMDHPEEAKGYKILIDNVAPNLVRKLMETALDAGNSESSRKCAAVVMLEHVKMAVLIDCYDADDWGMIQESSLAMIDSDVKEIEKIGSYLAARIDGWAQLSQFIHTAFEEGHDLEKCGMLITAIVEEVPMPEITFNRFVFPLFDILPQIFINTLRTVINGGGVWPYILINRLYHRCNQGELVESAFTTPVFDVETPPHEKYRCGLPSPSNFVHSLLLFWADHAPTERLLESGKTLEKIYAIRLCTALLSRCYNNAEE